MPIPDVIYVFQWWIVLGIIGILFLPLTAFFFSSFVDKGYIFAKFIGLGIVTYSMFVFGTLHILPFWWISLVGILSTCAWGNYLLLKKTHQQFFPLPLLIFILEEIFFLSFLFLWSTVRSMQPDIHGLEKFMDFGFINSLLRSTYFPGLDMWFPPLSINYYYFGHIVTAVITKISLIPSPVTFNLMIATLFAFCALASFSIGMNSAFLLSQKYPLLLDKHPKRRILSFGILSFLLTTCSGNFHMIYAFFKNYPLIDKIPPPPWELAFLPLSFPNSYWYPNATRFIYHTIHEFPMYSFVVSDLHGHVLDIPFVLCTIALLLTTCASSFFQKTPKKVNDKTRIPSLSVSFLRTLFAGYKQALLPFRLSYLLFLSFLLSLMYMTNAFDGPIYAGLSSVIILVVFFLFYHPQSWQQTKQVLQHVLLAILTMATLFLVFTLPFSFFFHPFASQIGVLCAPSFFTQMHTLGPFLFEQDHCQHSPFWQLSILYGFFYLCFSAFIFFLMGLKKQKKTWQQTDLFVLILGGFATLLILAPEFIYIKDIYPGHYRANTMFKLVYQAYILLSFVSAYAIFRISYFFSSLHLSLKATILRYLLHAGISLCVALVVSYTYFAVTSYYGTFHLSKGLSGIAYLKTSYPDDYDAIVWLNRHIKYQPIILEAQGDSYSDFARISANTGLPTVIGWTVHEWLWRGTYSIPAPRVTDVQTLYETRDVEQTKQLINQYDISLIYIGSLEKQKYPTLFEDKFKKLGKVIYAHNTTTIYQVSAKEVELK